MQAAARVLLWLYVIVLGVSVGAGLFEARVVVPIWASSPPETWVNTGTRFWAFITSGPLTLIILASLLVVWRFRGEARPWWLAALAVSVVERVATFAYFIPTMVGLQARTGLTPDVVATLDTWTTLNHARHAFAILAWLLALRALSKLSAPLRPEAAS